MTFFGYAAPPVGALRPAQPAAPLTSTYRATKEPRECALPSYPKGGLAKGSGEDCLFLEVQKPAHVKAVLPCRLADGLGGARAVALLAAPQPRS
jgi:carboxylesterase type B